MVRTKLNLIVDSSGSSSEATARMCCGVLSWAPASLGGWLLCYSVQQQIRENRHKRLLLRTGRRSELDLPSDGLLVGAQTSLTKAKPTSLLARMALDKITGRGDNYPWPGYNAGRVVKKIAGSEARPRYALLQRNSLLLSKNDRKKQCA